MAREICSGRSAVAWGTFGVSWPRQGRMPCRAPHSIYKVILEASPRRVRVKFNGEWIADSTAAHLLFETRHLPVYYFPRADVRMDLLRPTEHHTYCPYKGTASYWSIAVGNRLSENAVWGYPGAFDGVAAVQD